MPLFTVLIRPLRQDMPGCCANRTNATLSCTPVHPWWTAGQLKQEGYVANNSKDLFAGTKISVNNLRRIFGRKFFEIGFSTLWIVDVAKSQLGIAPWWWFCPGTKAFKRTQGENASCFADTSFLKGHCLLMRWVNKGFSGGLVGLNKFKAFSGGHSTIQPLWPCHQSNQGTKKAVKMTPRGSRPRWHLACLARLVGHRVRRRA